MDYVKQLTLVVSDLCYVKCKSSSRELVSTFGAKLKLVSLPLPGCTGPDFILPDA